MVRLSERLRRRRPVTFSPVPPEEESIPLAAEPPSSGPPLITGDLSRRFPPGELAVEEHFVSRLLYARLHEPEIAELRRLVAETPEFQDFLKAENEPAFTRMLILHGGLWHRLKWVSERTGLTPDQPPEDVHTMARGPLAAAGGLYEADLVADAVRNVGGTLESGRALDFGCSSGRIVRVLSAAFPGTEWLACDPNAPAIAWAQKYLPGIEFFVSGDEPPLALASGTLDLVYAVSIWSHFEPRLGLRWFDEMHRLLTPGGHLVLTTHGLTSVAFYAHQRLRPRAQSEEIFDALYRRGEWYAAEFAEEGDWGVVNPAWGTAFLTPEWLLANLCPRWHVAGFAPGRNSGNQDLYVLERI